MDESVCFYFFQTGSQMTLFFGMLPLVAFVVWAGVMRRWRGLGDAGVPALRQVMLTVAGMWAVWLVLGTELLSVFSGITRPMLIVWWLIPIVAGGWILLRRGRGEVERAVGVKWTVWEGVLMGVLVLIVAGCGITAILSPPMNYDSLTYHLPRMVMWAQHGNVAHYSTNNLRQLMMSPYTEFVGLHLMVLTGNDLLETMIQWFAYVLALGAVSLMARQLGAGRAGQILSAIIAATIPAMFLEASNSKNDVVEAMWVAIAAYWALTFLDRARGVMPRMVLLGVAIGAAVLTKGTGAFFTGPAAMVAAVSLFRQERMKAVMPLVVMGVVALAMNAGHFGRNYRQFGKIAGPEKKQEGGYELVNGIKTPPAIASNVLRNLAIEVGTPWPAVNDWMDNGINRVHEWLGIDPHDERLTFRTSPYTGVAYHPREEDRSGSPAHVALALLTVPVGLVIFRKLRFGRVVLVYGLGVGTFVIFCMMLRWQEWNTRLIFPSLCLLAPAMGAVWTAGEVMWVSPVMVLGLLVGFWPTVHGNYRPLWGEGNVFRTSRLQMRFRWMPNDIPAFEQAVKAIALKHPKLIGLVTDDNSPDYVLMRLLLDQVKPAPAFEYINPYWTMKGSVAHAPDVIIGKSDSRVVVDPCTGRTFVAVLGNSWFTTMMPGSPDSVVTFPFDGFGKVSGLNPVEGPYPQWDLPEVRWGIFPETRLEVPSKGVGKWELYMEVRRNDNTGQTLEILLNGESLTRFAFSGAFRFEPIQVALPLREGKNEVVIRYGSGDNKDAWPEGRGALFRMLQVRKVRGAGGHS